MKKLRGKLLKFTISLLLVCSMLTSFSISVLAANNNIGDKEPPIILLPGIMGSNLYADEECKTAVWALGVDLNPFSEKSFYKLGKNIEISKPIYVKNGRDNAKSSVWKREYGAACVYKKLMDKLCKEFPNREIYLFSYDFRQSNEKSAKELRDFIDNTIKADSVDIISHSMGGNVVANYAKKDSSKIHKFISLAAPLEGAPKIINAVLENSVIGTKWNPLDYALALFGLRKEVKAGFSSIAELFPTQNYFNSTAFKSKFKNGNSEEVRDIDYATYYKYCKSIFGSKFDDALRVQKSIDTDNVNFFRNFSNAYFVFGVDQKTVSSVVFKDGNNLSELGVDSLIYDNNGDGTVPNSSLTLMGQLENSAAHIRCFKGVSHANIISKDESINWIIDTLKNKNADEGLSFVPESKSYVVMRVEAPVDVNVKKNGETLTSEGNVSTEGSFGRIDTIGQDKQVKMIAIDDDCDVKFDAKDEGKVDFTIEWYDANNNLKEKRQVKNVDISKDAKVSPSSLNRGDNTSILVDENNDGVIDLEAECK